MREYRNEEHYVFPPKEVIKPGKVLDESIRQQGLHKVYVGRSADSLSREIEDMTRKIHKEFNLSDFHLLVYYKSKDLCYRNRLCADTCARRDFMTFRKHWSFWRRFWIKHLIQMNI